MKKIILIGSVAISSLLFGFFSPFEDFSDTSSSDICSSITPQCFDAFSVDDKIQTQVVGDLFTLKVKHNSICGLGFDKHISVALIDNQTGDMITSPQSLPATTSDEVNVTFEVDKLAYKNVSVGFFNFYQVECNSNVGFNWMSGFIEMFNYLKDNHTDLDKFLNIPFILGGELECHQVDVNIFPPSVEDKIVNCPSNLEDIKKIVKNKIVNFSGFKTSFMYAIPKGGQCFMISTPCDLDNGLITKSSDSFAIRPYNIEIGLGATNIKANTQIPITISVKDKNGNIIENYDNSSTNLKVTFTDKNGNIVDAQYAFDIKNGVGKGIVIFPNEVEGVKISVIDEHFADIDKSDTLLNRRKFSGESSAINVSNSSGSKYWAGTGTEEVENDPTKNTIDTDIKQNVKKDLHYKKMEW
jgi:hypothetical protein